MCAAILVIYDRSSGRMFCWRASKATIKGNEIQNDPNRNPNAAVTIAHGHIVSEIESFQAADTFRLDQAATLGHMEAKPIHRKAHKKLLQMASVLARRLTGRPVKVNYFIASRSDVGIFHWIDTFNSSKVIVFSASRHFTVDDLAPQVTAIVLDATHIRCERNYKSLRYKSSDSDINFEHSYDIYKLNWQ